ATAYRACQVYVAKGQPLAGFVRLEEEGEAVVLPRTARLSRLKLGGHRVCALSGRALDGISGVDESIPLSDHAGFDELMEYAERSGARRVLAIAGHAEELSLALRRRGIEAFAVREHRQLDLPGF